MSTPKSTATTQPETANMETPEEDASTSTPDTMSKINTAPEAAISILFNRIMTKFAEFLMPTFLRREYRNIIDTLAKSTYAFLALVLVIVFAIAEYQQPGYIPRPDKWTYGLVGFLCAGSLVFGLFALMAYDETHTWPWEDDGWVWPWEALLWSNTVYLGSDEVDLSVSINQYTYAKKPASPRPNTPLRDDGGTEAGGWTVVNSNTSPGPPQLAGSDDPILPSTPFLPKGLRPVILPPPQPMHHSGLLGESPAPIAFKHFSSIGFLGLKEDDIKEEEEA